MSFPVRIFFPADGSIRDFLESCNQNESFNGLSSSIRNHINRGNDRVRLFYSQDLRAEEEVMYSDFVSTIPTPPNPRSIYALCESFTESEFEEEHREQSEEYPDSTSDNISPLSSRGHSMHSRPSDGSGNTGGNVVEGGGGGGRGQNQGGMSYNVYRSGNRTSCPTRMSGFNYLHDGRETDSTYPGIDVNHAESQPDGDENTTGEAITSAFESAVERNDGIVPCYIIPYRDGVDPEYALDPECAAMREAVDQKRHRTRLAFRMSELQLLNSYAHCPCSVSIATPGEIPMNAGMESNDLNKLSNWIEQASSGSSKLSNATMNFL